MVVRLGRIAGLGRGKSLACEVADQPKPILGSLPLVPFCAPTRALMRSLDQYFVGPRADVRAPDQSPQPRAFLAVTRAAHG